MRELWIQFYSVTLCYENISNPYLFFHLLYYREENIEFYFFTLKLGDLDFMPIYDDGIPKKKLNFQYTVAHIVFS